MEVKRSFFTTFNHSFSLEHTEEVNCNLCGSDKFNLLATELSFDIRECTNCGLVYVNPQPTREELPKFYAGMYTTDAEEEVRARSLGAVERHLRKVLIRRRPNGGRLLEIGCGYGPLLKRIEDLPWELSAIDVSETAVQYVRRNVPKASVEVGVLEDVEFPPASQDCIVLVAVMEHMKDPRAAFERLTSWLAPGGLLIVQVPYVTPYFKLKKWLPWLPIHFEAPRHLFDFSPKTLPRYFEQAGLTDIEVEVARPYSSSSALAALMLWGIKLPGIALCRLTRGRYIYPFSAAIVVHASKKA